MNLFDDFKLTQIETAEARINVRYGGEGPPVLLLHGHPQTHVMWHRVAPVLARNFTVVCADLRGYGDSSKPATTPDHEPYSKRAMARDQVDVMRQLGFERFAVVGHDRGGRCAYRLALDHPHQALALCTLDILPTAEHFWRTDKAFALGYWHWFFLAQPFDLPERLIGADPDAFYLRVNRSFFSTEALAEYRRSFSNPETIHAMCEDYRAAATLDLENDKADFDAGRRITCPTLVLWGKQGGMNKWYDVLKVWQGWATNVEGRAIDCGHYLAEEAPEATLMALQPFLTKAFKESGH